jgi:biopolymer transport protein ExbD
MAAKLSGGGGGRYSLGQNADINVTPFVDILLVLLIIFMVAVPMAVTSIKIDLPPAVPSNDPHPKKPIFISIQKSGALYVAEKQTSLDNLQFDLDAAFNAEGQAGPKDDQRVMIRADADVLYADFMGVLNQLQTAGWYKVGLINEDIH